nr:hypothetical protein [Rhodospirillales bacterium]
MVEHTRATSVIPGDLFNSDGDFDEPPFHLITTDHPYMATLGLSEFTTGTLYRWWNTKNSKDEYENHKYFAKDPTTIEDKTFPSLLLLGEDIVFSDKDGLGKQQFAFQGFRFDPIDFDGRRSGRYETFYIDDGSWTYSQEGLNEIGQGRDYTYFDLDFTEYDDKFLTESMDKEHTFEVKNKDGKLKDVTFKSVYPITHAITLNDYVRDLELNTVLKNDPDNPWDGQKFARSEFIRDIYTSKEEYVEWSGLVPFYFRGAGGAFECSKSSWVTYKLQLFPNSAPKSTKRSIAVSTPTFVGPPVDSLGRTYQNREDARFDVFPEGSETGKVVAELDMTYNEYTSKWEAGSKQMIGIITQKVPKARGLSVSALFALNIEDGLRNSSDPSQNFVLGSGSAMSISQQNGNPMQWTPNYQEPSEKDEFGKLVPLCDEEEPNKKAEMKVFNASSKALNTDQMVLLNQIDGQWLAIDFPSGIEEFDPAVEAGFQGRWEFSYCATNSVHHFRDKNWEQIDSDDIVNGFHRQYYKNDFWNKDTNKNAYDFANLQIGGYHQFTSFDMMDKFIAGTRARGNAYATTNSQIAANGDTIESDADGYHTGAFFGCIFPDGYNSKQIKEYRDHRRFNAEASIAHSGQVDGGSWNGGNYLVWGDLHFHYFHDDGIRDNVAPFGSPLLQPSATRERNDCGGEHAKDDDGEVITMFDNDTDSSLTNLPADIATNAAPSGQYGQPITNLHLLGNMYFQDDPIQLAEQTRVLKKMGQNWLRRDEGTDEKGIPIHMESSAFDFKPKRTNHIVFRPLKAEVYAQFSQPNEAFEGLGAGGARNSQQSRDRLNFGGEMCKQMISKFKPSSHIAHQRELLFDASLFTYFDLQPAPLHTIYNATLGLQFNTDIPSSPTSNFQISPKAKLPTNDRFRWDVWGRDSNDWCHGNFGQPTGELPSWYSSDYEPAGAVGIIGAVASCTAGKTIKFDTNHRLGVWDFSYIVSFFGIPARTERNPAWGTGDNYKDFQTTGLHVKIYESWPREDTIYDPRYFAVHHFNAGMLSLKKSDTDPLNPDVITRTKCAIVNQIDPLASEKRKDYEYEIDEPIYGVDYRVPSVKLIDPNDIACTNRVLGGVGGLLNNRPISLHSMVNPNAFDISSLVWSDQALDPSMPHYHELMPSEQWNIDTSRRGKLLPYRYLKKTIQPIPFFNSTDSE